MSQDGIKWNMLPGNFAHHIFLDEYGRRVIIPSSFKKKAFLNQMKNREFTPPPTHPPTVRSRPMENQPKWFFLIRGGGEQHICTPVS